jgi:hypothetical protein
MTMDFYYKGLGPEDRIFAQSLESSSAKAKGTMYEAWFEVLQTSPWYRSICETGEFPSEAAKITFEKFGDLRRMTFSNWWQETGYKIFAEVVPYQPMQIADLKIAVKNSSDQKKPPMLIIEVPLNLSPTSLKEQFNEILKAHELYSAEFDRWDYSTAEVHQDRETKLTYATIKNWMKVYKAYEKERDKVDFKLYNFAKELELHPTLFRGLQKKMDVPEDLRIEASNVASDILKKAMFLMANATEMSFPNTASHEWAVTRNRAKKNKKE